MKRSLLIGLLISRKTEHVPPSSYKKGSFADDFLVCFRRLLVVFSSLVHTRRWGLKNSIITYQFKKCSFQSKGHFLAYPKSFGDFLPAKLFLSWCIFIKFKFRPRCYINLMGWIIFFHLLTCSWHQKTKQRIHQFTNLNGCQMSFKAFKMKKQGWKCFLK